MQIIQMQGVVLYDWLLSLKPVHNGPLKGDPQTADDDVILQLAHVAFAEYPKLARLSENMTGGILENTVRGMQQQVMSNSL